MDSAAGTPADWRATLTALVALLRTSGMLPQIIVAASDESDADDTLHNDAELLFSVVANGVWVVELFLLFTSGASNVPDVKVAFTYPASATLSGNAFGIATGSTTITSFQISAGTAIATPTNFGSFGVLTSATSGATPLYITFTLRTGATAGTLQLQWAQNTTTGGTPTVRKADSWLRYTRVS